MKLFLIFLITINLIFASNVEDLANQAIDAENAGNYQLSMELLDSAYSISNDNIHLFNKALLFYKTKKYPQVTQILEEFIYDSEPKEDYYRLLISSYDFMADQKKARDILNKALEIFPNSGLLYYELGVIEIGAGNRREAGMAWEKSINLDPNQAIVYYQLTKYFYDSDYRVLSLIYGEIFLNMISSDDKKQEISSILYEIYLDVLSNPQDGIYPITKFYGNYDVDEAINYPFQMIFQQTVNSLNFKRDKIGLEEIVDFRIEFFQTWFDRGYDQIYSISIFDRFKKIMQFKKFKEYSYMMLSTGDLDAFQSYSTQNMDAFRDVIIWITNNEFVIDQTNLFYSGKFREE